MRKVLFIFMLLVPSVVLAQWERWEPWVTDIGITPYAELDYRVATPDSLGSYELGNGGPDLKVAMQVCLPPFYITWGFSNLLGMLMSKSDTVIAPPYANCRVGTQLTYEDITTYDFSLAFIKNLKGDMNFMSLILECGYGRQIPLQIGNLQILGTAGGGMITKSIPDTSVSDEKETVLNLSVGAFWRTLYAAPYLYTGISYPANSEEAFEIRYFVAVGAQFYFPNAYVKGIPDIAYPKTWTFPSED